MSGWGKAYNVTDDSIVSPSNKLPPNMIVR